MKTNIAAAISMCALCAAPALAAPDAIYINGDVYTSDDAQPRAEAFAVEGSLFSAVGSTEEISALADAGTVTVDLQGRFVTPGFIDTHFHAVAAAIVTAEFDTGDIPDNEGMFEALREFAATQEGRTEPLITYGWHLQNYPPEGPHKRDLDAIFPDYPVLFVRSDGHGAWANSKALEVAGITRETPDPTEQSYYQRDENGEPTGFIEEIPAYFAVYYPMIGEISEEWIEERVTRAFPKFPAAGLTTAFDPGVLFAPSVPAMNAVHAYNEKNGASLRLSMSHYSVNREDDFAAAQALVANSRSEHVFSDSIKINVDASHETGTGFVKRPYVGRYEGSNGTTVFPVDEFLQLIDKSYEVGMNMHFHSVGDAGTELVLQGMEASIASHGPDKARANVTHATLVDPADFARFTPAQTGISFGALWIMPHSSTDATLVTVGEDMEPLLYPAGRFAAAGGVAAIGSDYPVAATFPSFRPLDSMEMMVRRARAGDPDAAMLGTEEDRLSVDQAIRAATINNAWLMNKEDEFGSVTPGKSADFVVLAQSLFDVPESEISKVEIVGTYYRGTQTFAGQ